MGATTWLVGAPLGGDERLLNDPCLRSTTSRAGGCAWGSQMHLEADETMLSDRWLPDPIEREALRGSGLDLTAFERLSRVRLRAQPAAMRPVLARLRRIRREPSGVRSRRRTALIAQPGRDRARRSPGPVCKPVGAVTHLAQRDVTFLLASRSPLDVLNAYRARMGWEIEWVSSEDAFDRDFYEVMHVPTARRSGNMLDVMELMALSVFALDDGVVYHAYSTS
jgi:hypothetical protein